MVTNLFMARSSSVEVSDRGHAATWRWLALIQPSYCARMMWQFTHARGSLVR